MYVNADIGGSTAEDVVTVIGTVTVLNVETLVNVEYSVPYNVVVAVSTTAELVFTKSVASNNLLPNLVSTT